MKRNIFKLNEVKCWDIESSIYNLTCPRNGIYTLTIPDVDFDTDQNTNWTCKFIGVRSNIIALDVNDGFYEGIDDSTRESDAKTTYEELQNSQNAGPVARGGVMFGAGVGVGMACLVPFIVAAAVYIVCRRGRQTLKDADPTQATEMTVNRTAQPSDGFYEGIDDSTRESDAKTTYEELQNSQNAGPVARGDGFYEGIDDSTRESDAKTTYEDLQISQNAGPVERGDGFYEGIDDSTRESDAKTTYEELQISQNAGPVV
ncbi:uncharacterized protein LOC124151285 isoform X4 [Haliotis rufescens]|uniref:uncharacterized protein LOC124151285 isoform X4 n=1 Tax=Haliotis rufescens TaxID=6454 RepID=UPI00201F71B1|nr:uncharacterized protein LOC124151285 isoform X4 [Haliotis rufescens]